MISHRVASDISLQAFLELKKKYPNVQSVAFGPKKVAGRDTSELAMIITVVQKLPMVSLSKEQLLPKEMYGFKTDVQMFGEHRKHDTVLESIIKSIDPTQRFRPITPGISVGHYAITAGTIGSIVRDLNSGVRLILSNNHVLANSNAGLVGDDILQPGPYDGGVIDKDTVALLLRYVPIQFITDVADCQYASFYRWVGNKIAQLFGSRYRVSVSAIEMPVNYVDCAVAQLVVSDIAIPSNEIPEIGLVADLRDPVLGEAVEKTGRTTYYQTGYVDMIGQTTQVSYGDNQIALFTGQYATTGSFSAGGDSGSLIVAQSDKAGVGLLFAGGQASDGSEITIWNPLTTVFEELQIKF